MAYPYLGRPVSFAHSNGGYYGGRTLYAGSTPFIPGQSLPIDAYGHGGYQGYPVISVPPSPYPMATQLSHYGYPTSTAYPITSAGYHASLDATRSCHSAADSCLLLHHKQPTTYVIGGRRRRRYYHRYRPLGESILRFLGLYHCCAPDLRYIDSRTGYTTDRRGRTVYRV